MSQNIVQKILSAHLIEGDLENSEEVGIRIDQTLTQDATGTMAYLQFEAMSIPKVQTEVSVSYVDHNTLEIGFENSDDHEYLRTVAAKYGIKYSKAGNGICHQVHLERFGKPGKTLLGSDSHTPTGGGIGMIAIGAGGLDVAVAMAGGTFYIPKPKVLKIQLNGKLQDWVSAKDIILKVLSILSTKGNVGFIVEYAGEGIQYLDVPARATITNMGAELGVTTSIFPSDNITKDFLKAQDREGDWIELIADKGATYDKEITINLNTLIPLVAAPHSPGNIKTVEELSGKNIHQVAVGSCTNSSYMDLMVVANTVKDHKLDPNTTCHLAPGSKQVFTMIANNGALAHIISSGFRIMESACGFCIGAGASPQTDAISVRTNNRNFFGRSGTNSAGIYLVSPETAAACALTGVLTDPRTLKDAPFNITYDRPPMPKSFTIDDSMVIEPIETPNSIKIFRGPNISKPPEVADFQNDIVGLCTIKVGDKITTDDISPAGFRLKFRSNIPKYSSFTFELIDNTFSTRCLKNKEETIANFIIGGDSYGQGSSREHAALCPMYLGVKAVIAKSFERIHYSNLVNFGILPLLFKNEADYEKIEKGDALELHDTKSLDTLILQNKTKGIDISLRHNLSERQIKVILQGGQLNYQKNLFTKKKV